MIENEPVLRGGEAKKKKKYKAKREGKGRSKGMGGMGKKTKKGDANLGEMGRERRDRRV